MRSFGPKAMNHSMTWADKQDGPVLPLCKELCECRFSLSTEKLAVCLISIWEERVSDKDFSQDEGFPSTQLYFNSFYYFIQLSRYMFQPCDHLQVEIYTSKLIRLTTDQLLFNCYNSRFMCWPSSVTLPSVVIDSNSLIMKTGRLQLREATLFVVVSGSEHNISKSAHLC
jgi:hypothetical protein